jgi:cation:H+ antiporter
VPDIAVGNLIGASIVLLLLIVPLLALAGNNIRLNGAIDRKTLGLILAAVALPALLSIDGDVTKTEGLLAFLAYGTAAYALYRNRVSIIACEIHEERQFVAVMAVVKDLGRIVLGAIAIFAAAHFLVEQAVYFAELLSAPASLMGLILLSLGTNVPELVIAVRAIFARRADIAFGDYLGSAAMNTLIFAELAFDKGPFSLEASEFMVAAGLLAAGLLTLFIFLYIQGTLGRKQGLILILFYAAFVAMQGYAVLRFAGM